VWRNFPPSVLSPSASSGQAARERSSAESDHSPPGDIARSASALRAYARSLPGLDPGVNGFAGRFQSA